MNTKRLTFCALLTAIALTIFMVEAQLPHFIPVPGFRWGLANIITVYAMFALGPRDTFLILISRIFLGSMFGGFVTFLYSLFGGLACYLIMLVLRKVLTLDQLWVCGAIGSIFHNLGQSVAAIIKTGTPQIVVIFLPQLLVVGIITGAFTGLAAQLLLKKLDGKMKF